MSSQALSWVLDHSPTEGTERLVLLSLANHAGASPAGDAWEASPPIEVIQREANLRRERTVQEVLLRLVEGGHIERVLNGMPDERVRADRRPNLYRILLSRGVQLKPTTSARSRGAVRRRPGSAPRGAASRQTRGAVPQRPAEAQHGVPPHATRGAAPRRSDPPPDGTPPASRSSSSVIRTTLSQSSVTAGTGECATEDGPTDPRIEPSAVALGTRDFAAAIADGVAITHRPSYLEACIERWRSGSLRVVLDRKAGDHPEWDADQIVADIDRPTTAADEHPPPRAPTDLEARASARQAGTACPRCQDSGWWLPDGATEALPCDHEPERRPELYLVEEAGA